MTVPEKLLEVREYAGVGYQPLIDFGAWRVAILRHIEELDPQKIHKMQRHHDTDEVFVLLEGRCILFVADGEDSVREIFAEDMQPLKLYNVKRNAWHSHTLSPHTTVLIVENRDTTNVNSADADLTPSQQAQIAALTQQLWK